MGPECVQELVGDGSESPQECIAVEVIDGGGPCSELAEFLDPLFDDRTVVVAAPGGEGVDAFDVGEHVSAQGDFVGVEREGVWALERTPCLEREKTDAPQTAGGGPELMTGEDVLTLARATPGLVVVGKPAVGRELEQETDIEVIEGPYHGSAEEALVETHGDGLDPHGAQAPHQVGDPRLGPRSGGGVARAPTDAHTVSRLLNEGQKRMVRRPAGLVWVVAPLGARLLQSVAYADGGVEDQGQRPGHAPQSPAPAHDVPQEFVEEGHERLTCAAQPASERGGIGQASPAEQASNAAPVQERQIVEHAPTVEQQDDPHLDHQAGTEEAGKPFALTVDPGAQAHAVPQIPDQNQPASIGQIPGAVTNP